MRDIGYDEGALVVAPKDDIEQVISRSSVELKTECEFVKSHNQTFCEIVCAHMQLKGYNKPIFEQKTLLSGRTYDRIRGNQLESPSIETVMAICIGLELGVEYGEHLLEITGHKLGDIELHAAYRKLLVSFKGRSIVECNAFLDENHLPPLVKRALKDN